MVELLMAVVLLSICAAAILNGVTLTGKRASLAAQKALILNEAQNWMESTKAKGKLRTLVAGTSSVSLSITGVPFQVQRNTSIALVPGYTDLYDVSCTMQWNGNTTADQKGAVTLQSKVVSPDD